MADNASNNGALVSTKTALLGGLTFVAGFHLLAMYVGAAPDFSGNNWYVNWDTDSYTRILRVLHLHQTGDWFGATEPYFNAPFGSDMHWTRPLDVLLYVGAWAGSFFTDFKTALEVWAMVAVGPLLHLLFIPLLYWGTRSLVSGRAFLLLALMFVSLIEVSRVHLAGFIDFHGIQVMVLLALMLMLGKQLIGDQLTERYTLGMGLLAGSGVWMSVESLVLVMPALLAMAVLWIWDGDEWLDALARFSFGFGAMLAIAVVVERPSGDWLSLEYDRVSIMHAVIAVALSAAIWILGHFDYRGLLDTFWRRLVAGGLVGSVAVFGLLLLFPALAGHPQQDLGPIVSMVLDSQSGETSFFARSLDPMSIGTRLGPLIIAFPYTLWCLYSTRGKTQRRFMVYLVFMVSMTFYLMFFGRAITFVQISYLLPWFEAICAFYAKLRQWLRKTPHPVLMMAQGVALAAVFGHTAAYAVTKMNRPDRASSSHVACHTDQVLAAIAEPDQDNRGRSILAPIFMGPVIAYKSGYSVIGAPYHRNIPGIEVGFILNWSDPDDPEVRALAASRKIAYVFICRSYVGYKKQFMAQNPKSLMARLAAERPPGWLEKVDLPPPLAKGAILYRWSGNQ